MSNPHIENATKLAKASEDGSLMPAAHQANWIAMAHVQATLALAYEAQTANMVAWLTLPYVEANESNIKASNAIRDRLVTI